MSASWRKGLAWALSSAVAGTAAVWACGPFFTDLLTVKPSSPADRARYARGELGVVKPAFERRYLVQAYRTMAGVGPLPAAPPAPSVPDDPALPRWIRIEQRVLRRPAGPVAIGIRTDRISADYSSFPNCHESAFRTAVAAYDERAARYGAGSPEIVDWVGAQATVFQNCGGGALALPQAAGTSADARLKADRDYQIAAAYFYAAQYDEAAGRFRAIASNAVSAWRPWGRYLAARALIRSVTIPSTPPKDAAQRFAAAERDLQAALADRDAAPLHPSAQRLLDFVAARTRPLARLHTLAARLGTAASVAPQDLVDYRWLMDRAMGEAVTGTLSLDLAEVTKGDDLTDWIVAMQRGGTRALERWQQTRTERWLVAALWTTPARHAEIPALLSAAAQVPPTSPAFSTAAFLRVRLLIQRNDLPAARAALAALPAAPGPGVDAETINLLSAARFTIAATLDEMLAAAPRAVVNAELEGIAQEPVKFSSKPVWDDDVAAAFNGRMPLEQLVAAAESTRLPARLRLRVAQAAFTRAALLERTQPGVRAARVVAALAAPLRADAERYIGASDDAARRRIAVLTLLRTPGLSINVGGRDTDDSFQRDTPSRRFGHAFPRNWWCAVEDRAGSGATRLISGDDVPFPPFITEAERRELASELDALSKVGSPRAYLTSAAIEWARERRADPDAAEALALAVEGWRWSRCDSDPPKSELPSRAFVLLHRQFPQSDWAQRTKYWYD
jgi:hypothetical protein